MSDNDLPDLPSDEELGITADDRERYEEDLPEERPELSEEEMLAFLGETVSPKAEEAEPPAKKTPDRKRKKGSKGAHMAVVGHRTMGRSLPPLERA